MLYKKVIRNKTIEVWTILDIVYTAANSSSQIKT